MRKVAFLLCVLPIAGGSGLAPEIPDIEGSSALPLITVSERHRLLDNPEQLSPASLNDRVLDRLSHVTTSRNPSSDLPSNNFRLFVWNAERGMYWSQFANWFKNHEHARSSDLILLNEVDFGMARSGNIDVTKRLANVLGMHSAFGVEFLELTNGLPQEQERTTGVDNKFGYHGNSILTRYPLKEPFVLRLKRPIDQWYRGEYSVGHSEKRLGGRMALISKISVGGGDILYLVSAHLECKIGDHRQDAVQICDRLNRLKANHVVLGGDLCDDPGFFETLSNRCGFLPRSAANMSGREGFTWPTHECSGGTSNTVGTRGDFIGLKGVKVVPGSLRTIVPDDNGKCLSDHAAITVDFTLY
eukprot:c8395_g1_i1.p1 GENE.c8395_g1_i1~~c8395_g1_i1.p1  ORF type:complete len:358 (+),score=83.44 c8395_g1_i1:26-1099(+)